MSQAARALHCTRTWRQVRFVSHMLKGTPRTKFLQLLLTALLGCHLSNVWSREAATQPVWFHNVSSLSLSQPDAAALLQAVRSNDIPGAQAFSHRLRNDVAPRIVFVSVRTPGGRAQVALGTGHGVTAAIEDSLADLELTDLTRSWIRLDVVQSTFLTVSPGSSLSGDKLGTAFHPASRVGLLFDEMNARSLMSGGRADVERINTYTRTHRRGTKPLTPAHMVNVYRFSTEAWMSFGDETYPVSDPIEFEKKPDSTRLTTASNAALRYLERHISDRGEFPQSVYGSAGQRPQKPLMHITFLPWMQHLAELTDNYPLHHAINNFRTELPGTTEPCRTIMFPNTPGRCVVDWAQTHPTASARATVALLGHPSETKESISVELGEWLLHRQSETGQFDARKTFFPLGEPSEKPDPRFQGWATLALVRLYLADSQPHWLKAAARSVEHYLNQSNSASKSRFRPDLPMLRALALMQDMEDNARYEQHLLEAARLLTQSQLPQSDTGGQGIFHLHAGRYPNAWVGLCLLAAYPVVQEAGGYDLKAAVELSLHATASRVLSSQFNAESAFFLWRPEQHSGALGDVSSRPLALLLETMENLSFLLEYQKQLMH